jgi:hypothetical protein
LICKLNLNGEIVNKPDAHWLTSRTRTGLSSLVRCRTG